MRQHFETARLRSAIPEDIKTILWLEEICMKGYAEALWGNWRPSATPETLDISIHEMVVVTNQIVGCVATRLLPGSLNLAKLYLSPGARNQGIGAWVLRQLLARADASDRPVQLRVLTNNPAVRFYARHGFRVERRTQDHFYMIHERGSQNQEGEP